MNMVKVFSWILIVSLFLTLTPAIAQENPGEVKLNQGGEVTIPLEQFLQMIKEASPTPPPVQMPPPPVKLVFGTAQMEAVTIENALKVSCSMPFELYEGWWQEISFISELVAISEAKIDGQDVSVYKNGGRYTILYKGKGRHTLEFTYLVPATRKDNTTSSTLYLPSSSSSNLSLLVYRTGINIKVDTAMGGKAVPKEDKTIYTATLPAGEAAQVSWTLTSVTPDVSQPQNGEKPDNPVTVKNEPPPKPKIYSQTYSLVSVSVGAIRVTGQINLSLLRGQAKSLSFLLPKDVEILDVKSDKYRDRTVEDVKDGKKLTVFLTDYVEGDQQITVVYEKPLENVSTTWNVPSIKVLDAEQDKGFVACETLSSLSMEQASAQDITRVDVKELPGALTGLASTPVILSYRYYKHPYVLDIETKRYEELPVLSATIDTAQAMTFINDEGVSLTKVIYQMRNNTQQFLEVKLPSDSEILNAFVAGSPVKPVSPGETEDKGVVLIPLRKSDAGGDSGLNSFAVEVSYKTKGKVFASLGNAKQALPSCNVQISEYYWTIYFPEDNRVLGFFGNMKPGGGPAPSTVAYDEGLASKLDAPSVEVSTSEISLSEAEVMPQDMKDKEQQVMIQNFASTSVADDSGKVSGLLPVELYIPQSGQVFYFKKLLLEDGQSPVVGVRYIAASYSSIFCWLALIITLAFTALLRKWGVNQKTLIPVCLCLVLSFFIGRFILLPEMFSYSLRGVFLALVYLFITSAFLSRGLNRFLSIFKRKNITVEEKIAQDKVVPGDYVTT